MKSVQLFFSLFKQLPWYVWGHIIEFYSKGLLHFLKACGLCVAQYVLEHRCGPVEGTAKHISFRELTWQWFCTNKRSGFYVWESHHLMHPLAHFMSHGMWISVQCAKFMGCFLGWLRSSFQKQPPLLRMTLLESFAWEAALTPLLAWLR